MKTTPRYCTSFLLLLLLGVFAPGSAALGSGTVTNCTQADLEAALAGGGTVLFATDGIITLTNTLNIRQDTTLDANGHQVTLSGGSAVRLFTVTNATLQVNALTLANGRFVGATGTQTPAVPGQGAAGACIVNQGGTVTLVGCTLTNHLARGGDAPLVGGFPAGNAGQAAGGAIFSQGGQINLTNCLVTGSKAVGGAGGNESGYTPDPISGVSSPALGGALYVSGASLTLQNVLVVSNSAIGGSGGAYAFPNWRAESAPGYGGGIYATNATVCAGDCLLAGNSANSGATTNGWPGWPSGEASGGALFLDFGATAGLDRCTLSNNAATAGLPGYHGQGGSAHGGAVFNGGILQVDNSTFCGNSALGANHDSASGSTGSLGQGGALYSTNMSMIAGCSFFNNLARGGAGVGGNPYVPGTTISGGGEGGGVWSSGSLLATNSTWATNQASAGAPNGGAAGPGSGGGVCITGGSAALVNVTLAGNAAVSISLYGAAGPVQGGALCNNNGLVLVMNSLVAYSASGSNIWGTLTDGGYNLSSDSTGGFTAPGSLMNTDPLLLRLADNGGPTLTMALDLGSPARDQIPDSFPPTDQRGVARPAGDLADIGAVEAPLAPSVRVLVQTVPAGLSIVADGTRTVTTPHTFYWSPGSCHTLDASTPGSGTYGPGARFFWYSWTDDSGSISRQVCPTEDTTYAAMFAAQYLLNLSAGTNGGGTVSPPDFWYSGGPVISISATPSPGFTFSGWSGPYTGTDNPAQVTVTNPVFETAWFTYTNPCSFALSASNATFSAAQDLGVVWVVNADTNCPWTISVPCDWVHITSGSQTAPAVNYYVEANPTADARECTLTIAGLPYTITQAGACLPRFAAVLTNVGPEAFEGSIALNVNGGCPWSASSSSPWLHTTNSGSGPDLVFFSVDANLLTNSRQAQLIVADQVFTVVQMASNPPTPLIFGKSTYHGLFFNPTNALLQGSGALTLSTTPSRNFTGRLFLTGSSYPFQGQFDSAGLAEVSVPRRGQESLSMHLVMPGQNTLTGSVASVSEDWSAVLQADRAVPTNACPFAGAYTWMIAGSTNPAALPGGDSWGTLRVSPAGSVTLAGSLADGTLVAQATYVTPDGRVPLFAPLARQPRLLLGWTYFPAIPTDNLHGQLVWIKAAASAKSARYYPGAFNAVAQLEGAKYTPPAAGQGAFGFTNGIVEIAGGNLPAPLTDLVQALAHNKLLPADQSAAPARLQLNLNAATGKFSGVFSVPPSRTTHSFHGVLLQNWNSGFGYFLGADQSGYVRLTPAGQ